MTNSTLFTGTAAALGLLLCAPQAMAEQACADRAEVVNRLERNFGETRQSMGLNAQTGVVEVYASDQTGTWTIVLTRPDGVSCLIASGEMWEKNAEPLVKSGQPA